MATRKTPAKPSAKPTARAAAPKAAAAPRKPAETSQPPFGGNTQANPSPEELWKQIAEAAYYKAKALNFTPGGEVLECIEAEA
jgi:hypothetical protein